VIIGIGLGFTSVARFCSGLWGYLTARAHGHTAVALERERNHATAEAIKALPPGAELVEHEPSGRLRVIRMPQTSDSFPAVIQLRIIQQTVIPPPVIHPPASGETRPRDELTE
jgi:hypothetical protein